MKVAYALVVLIVLLALLWALGLFGVYDWLDGCEAVCLQKCVDIQTRQTRQAQGQPDKCYTDCREVCQ